MSWALKQKSASRTSVFPRKGLEGRQERAGLETHTGDAALRHGGAVISQEAHEGAHQLCVLSS